MADCFWRKQSHPMERGMRTLRSYVFTLCVIAMVESYATQPDVAETAPIRLPPLIVEESALGPHWQHAEIPGFEILTRCDDATARDLVRAYVRAHREQSVLLPDRFQLRFDVPTTLIFYQEDLWPAISQQAVASMLQSLTPRIGAPRHSPDEPSAFDRIRAPDPLFSQKVADPPRSLQENSPVGPAPVFFNDMRLSDDDEVVIFALAPNGVNQTFRTFLRPTYVALLLANRTPSLPTWFISSFLSVYEQLVFTDDTVALAPLVWVSADENKRAQKRPRDATSTFLPMEKLLSEDPAVLSARDFATTRVATTQRELFVRWALDPTGNEQRRDAFWNLVDRSCSEPVSEQTLQASFGRSSAELLHELGAYLPVALRRGLSWQIKKTDLPDVSFRDATADEIARLRGDWERLQTGYVRAALPEVAAQYLAKTRQTLNRSYQNGDRDPRLLAVLGLCEMEAGNPAGARPYLEAAVAGSVVRPRAYIELARLRFSDMQKDLGDDERLTADQADELLKLLSTARRQAPKLASEYELAAQILERRGTSLTSAEQALLAEGIALFPRSAELAFRSAKLYAAAGRTAAAAALAQNALRLSATGAFVSRLRELQQALAANLRVAPRN